MTVVSSNALALPLHLTKLYSISKGTKLYYDVLNVDAAEPKCCCKWESKLNCEIKWKDCFFKIQKIRDVTLKWLQLRIVHRIIGTNVILSAIGVRTNDRCSFCNIEKDGIEHIFWNCHHTNQFLLAFERKIKEKCPHASRFKLTCNLVLFGIERNVKTDEVLDFIILLVKQYIYNCRFKSSLPTLDVFLKLLKYRFAIEEYNAKIHLNHSGFSAKWQMYKSLLN